MVRKHRMTSSKTEKKLIAAVVDIMARRNSKRSLWGGGEPEREVGFTQLNMIRPLPNTDAVVKRQLGNSWRLLAKELSAASVMPIWQSWSGLFWLLPNLIWPVIEGLAYNFRCAVPLHPCANFRFQERGLSRDLLVPGKLRTDQRH